MYEISDRTNISTIYPSLDSEPLPQPDPPQSLAIQTTRSYTWNRSQVLNYINGFIESAALRDGIKLMILGGALEAARRGFGTLTQQLKEQFTIHAVFRDTDISYSWLLAWLSTQSHQKAARSFEVNVRGTVPGKRWAHGDGFSFLPDAGGTRFVQFEGKTLRISRTVERVGWDPVWILEITVLTRSSDIIKRLVEEARLVHKAFDEDKIVVYTPLRHLDGWQRSMSSKPRSLDSVILPTGTKERLVKDVEGFFEGENWYAERGIPHRRGYLLHGVPGSGKTSIVTALAGHLGLDLYVMNLSQTGLDDVTLQSLIGDIPPKSLLLMEDIDCAFGSREAPSADAVKEDSRGDGPRPAQPSSASRVTFSGLLNSLDGVAAQEGSLLCATTNHPEALDPALKRPGRMDVWLEFKNATKQQAKDLFLHFYPSTSNDANDIERLAQAYTDAIPEGKFAVAALQAYLMDYKSEPEAAVRNIADWSGHGK